MNKHPLDPAMRRAVSFVNDGKFFEADMLYRQLLRSKPDIPLLYFMYGTFLLLKGEYAAAWPHFQRRLDDAFYKNKPTMQFPQPFWNGKKRPKKTLLVHIDQGIGDAIMCARFIPAAADRVGKLIFAAHERMRRFYSRLDPRVRMVQVGDPVPEFDIHVDLFSLPAYFGAASGNMPEPPYLSAEPDVAAKWKERLAGPEFRVGLAWQGNPQYLRDGERSMHLKQLEPILRTPGVKCFGLQVGSAAEQAKDLPADIAFENLAPELTASDDNMVDTAGAVANLDLVISIDSSMAHLAAAMGRPTWVATFSVPDWRWLRLTGTDPVRYENAPWYPKARIFVKRERYDWTKSIVEIAAALAAEVTARKKA